MKKLILIAIAIVGLSSCAKQRVCTCKYPGNVNKHEIYNYNEAECLAYEGLSPGRECTYDE